ERVQEAGAAVGERAYGDLVRGGRVPPAGRDRVSSGGRREGAGELVRTDQHAHPRSLACHRYRTRWAAGVGATVCHYAKVTTFSREREEHATGAATASPGFVEPAGTPVALLLLGRGADPASER